jgi:hypothetical protein
LRFSRDKRGYENTFVVHAEKRRGRSRSRILYWFRTPPGVKVGRSALDEDAIRLIEEHNPDVDFDWTRILKGGGEPGESRKPDPSRQDMRQRGPSAQERRPIEQVVAPPIELSSVSMDVAEELTVEILQSSAPIGAGPEEPLSPAQARLGAEAVIRLRGRYSEILARIGDRVQDPARRDELKTEAERLNPDSWVTDAEVQQGLEQYEAVFESLRAVVGRRRRRRRRRGGRPEGSAAQMTPAAGPDPDASEERDAEASEDNDDGDEPGSGEL